MKPDAVTRAARVRAAADAGIRRWRQRMADPSSAPAAAGSTEAAAPVSPRSNDEVFVPLQQRRPFLEPTGEWLRLPAMTPVVFRASSLRCLVRLWQWLTVAAHLQLALIQDRFAGNGSQESRARRLRQSLERAGGTFVKLGQQVAMRIDLLPWAYCVEFSRMLDRMAPFPLEQALAAIERAAGRPWQEVFDSFDPEPIGSASIACVYQARLKDGTHVAIKVRRPGIGDIFLADFRILDGLFGVVEALALVRPGFTRNLRRELRETLMEELDFRREAQFQHAFRHNARRKSRRTFFTAPRVYFEFSNDDVLVQEFVTGMWLSEVIATVEEGDATGLALMRQLNIDPGLVGRRILWASFWSIEENLFFHADPHPANIVVGPDSTVTFIDFGSCGSFNDEQRSALEQIGTSMRRDDAEGMARGSLKLFEPMPPVDLPGLMKEAQAEYVRVLYTFRTKAKHTEWWERTSARLWLAMIRMARQRNLPMALGMLRMIRATLLYDTIVLRLDKSIDRYDEYERFRGDRASFARDRWRKRVRDSREQLLLRADEWLVTGDDLLERAKHALSIPAASFSSLIEKSVFAVATMGRAVGLALLLTAATTAVAGALRYLTIGAVDPGDVFSGVVRSPYYEAAAALIVYLGVRKTLFRLREREVDSRVDRGAA